MALPLSDKQPFVHAQALCDSRTVGAGTRIWAFSHVLEGAQIGRDCNVGEHVFIEGGVKIGDRCTIKNGVAIWDLVTLEEDVFVGPYVVFTNDITPRAFLKRGRPFWSPTVVRRGATLGANCTLVCGVEIGEFALVGAGAVVTKNVAPHAMVVGNPARQIGTACYCGAKLDKKQVCPTCKIPLAENSLDRTVAFIKDLRQLRTQEKA